MEGIMKKYLSIAALVLLFCFAAGSQEKKADVSSGDLEKELMATIATWQKAGKENDFDTLWEIQGDAIGYGYRTEAPRIPDEKSFRAGQKMAEEAFESFEMVYNPEDFVFRFIGNVCVILGSFTEKFTPKGGEPQTMEVRTSMTFVKVDGKWKLAQYHRDNQFAE
jgi:ketosteroid isomerase-like protein